MPNLSSLSNIFQKSDLERRTAYVFQWRFGISNVFGLFLLLLESGYELLKFCSKFWVKWVTFLASKCTANVPVFFVLFLEKSVVIWLRVNKSSELTKAFTLSLTDLLAHLLTHWWAKLWNFVFETLFSFARKTYSRKVNLQLKSFFVLAKVKVWASS